MLNAEIIKLAREVGYSGYDALAERLHEFAKLAYAAGAAAEREACAKLARDIGNDTEPDDWALDKCQEIEIRIRAR